MMKYKIQAQNPTWLWKEKGEFSEFPFIVDRENKPQGVAEIFNTRYYGHLRGVVSKISETEFIFETTSQEVANKPTTAATGWRQTPITVSSKIIEGCGRKYKVTILPR